MSPFSSNFWRIIGSVLLALPFALLAADRFVFAAITGYIGTLAVYWLVQACTKYQRPFAGLWIIGFLSLFFVLFLLAASRART